MKLANWVNFANDQAAESDYPGGSYVVTVFLSLPDQEKKAVEMSESEREGWAGNCCLRRKQI